MLNTSLAGLIQFQSEAGILMFKVMLSRSLFEGSQSWGKSCDLGNYVQICISFDE
jgi:hypothetical protein